MRSPGYSDLSGVSNPQVCPCLYSSVVGKYKAMYSSVEDDEEAVRIEKKAPPPAAASMEPKVPGTEV